MAKITILYSLFYNAKNLIRLIDNVNSNSDNHDISFVVTCSNNNILNESRELIIGRNVFIHERSNAGGGEGIFYWVQNKLKILDGDYVLYLEESCEPIKKDWVKQLVNQMEDGSKITGWLWNANGKKRKGSLEVKFRNNQNFMTAHINTDYQTFDSFGNSINGVWDTPGYRHEAVMFAARDFNDFKFSNPEIDFFTSGNDPRYYGIRAERFWWSDFHDFSLLKNAKSPNLQWSILMKYGYIPPNSNINRKYFRELAPEEKLFGKIIKN